MSTAQIGMFATMVVYLVAMLLMGAAVSKKNKTVGDFYLGGRKLGPFVTAMSAEASDMSSYLLMGIPGLAYLSGIADAGWTIIGLATGTYVNWLVTAKRIRRYSEETGSITVPAFFSDRYGDEITKTNDGDGSPGGCDDDSDGQDGWTAFAVCGGGQRGACRLLLEQSDRGCQAAVS